MGTRGMHKGMNEGLILWDTACLLHVSECSTCMSCVKNQSYENLICFER